MKIVKYKNKKITCPKCNYKINDIGLNKVKRCWKCNKIFEVKNGN